MTSTRSFRRRTATGIGAIALAGLLAACSSHAAATPANKPGASVAPSNGAAAARGGTPPGTFGTAAAVSSGSLEVQNATTGQVTVTFAATTTFTQTIAADLSSVTVGSCVTAAAAPTTGGSSTAPATSFAAATVVVSAAPVGGTCAADTFGGGFGGYGTAGGGRPTGTPSRSSGSTPRARGAFGDRATGTVASVSGATFTVNVPARDSAAATTATVTTTSATTFTQTKPAAPTDLQVGRCVSAFGTADDTGTVAATRIGISTPGPTGCTAGFGRPTASASPPNA